ncbi:MAG: polysaccharide ABC transporter ATP-binding protein, partial [Dolichospermum sp.]
MADTVIRVENLGKKYVIGHQKQERYTALRDVLAEKARSFGQMFSRNGKGDDPTHEEFWALKDVSFEIKQGDRVGIIGRNGAGKSTLLKILSRITEPTEGRISIKGRVASLLEVGTGFHPELTGRENIYLNGAILGMSKAEIKKKFDEIVAFAEVEKFLDTPVKRYSSGMYVRLAFAVAAHLEPEILIVDEVLAVGDAQFQKKCLGKMEDVGKEGKTILFVSHDLGFIQLLCSHGILLKEGKIMNDAEINQVIDSYNQVLEREINSNKNLLERKLRTGKGEIKISKIEILSHGKGSCTVRSGDSTCFIFHTTTFNEALYCSFTIYSHSNQPVAFFNSKNY